MTVYVDDNALVIRHPRLGRLCAKVAHVWRNLEKRESALVAFAMMMVWTYVLPPVGVFFVLVYVYTDFMPSSSMFPDAWLMTALTHFSFKAILFVLVVQRGCPFVFVTCFAVVCVATELARIVPRAV